jgi:hypothetical protein
VRVDAEDDAVAAGEVAVHPLDLVGVDVGRRHSTVVGRLRITLSLGRRAPGGGHGIADLEGEVEFGGGEGSGLYSSTHSVSGMLRPQLPGSADGRHRHVHHLGLAHAEDVLAEGLEVAL